MRLFTKQRHLHRFCQEPSRILRSALKKTSGRSAITTTDRLVCVKGGAVSVGTHAANWLFKLEGGAREFVLMVGEKRPTLFFFFLSVLRLFWIVRPNCNQGPTVWFRFLQMAHKKVLVQAFAKKYAFSLYVRWFVYLFLYFVVVILFFLFFFCWTQLLGPRHAERPNMALSVNRSPGATRQKNRGEPPGEI